MKEKIVIWMPEFIAGVNNSAEQLFKESKRLNKLAKILEDKNKEKERE